MHQYTGIKTIRGSHDFPQTGSCSAKGISDEDGDGPFPFVRPTVLRLWLGFCEKRCKDMYGLCELSRSVYRFGNLSGCICKKL